jgi:nicotinamidase-related amidase
MTTTSTPSHWSERLPAEDAAALAGYSSSDQITPNAHAPVLLVIDLVESFVGPDAPISEAQKMSRKACGEKAWAAIPAIVELIDSFRQRDLPIIFTRADPLQTHIGVATRRPDAARDRSLSNEFLDIAMPKTDDVVLPKVRASAFFGTPLTSYLSTHDHRTIVLTGCTTSGCIRATAVDGTSNGFNVLVAEDAVFDRSGISHDVALIDIDAKYGSVLPAKKIVELLDD